MPPIAGVGRRSATPKQVSVNPGTQASGLLRRADSRGPAALAGLRVVLAHGHSHVREGLEHLLLEEADVVEAAKAATVEETVGILRKGGWNVVILGSSFGGRPIQEQLAEFRRIEPALRCVLLSSYPHAGINALLMDCGADAVVLEERIDEDLIPVLQSVRRGEYGTRRGIPEDSARPAAENVGEPQRPALSSTDHRDSIPPTSPSPGDLHR
jgi:DNA-binding NarL/FixJ family response regulator